MDDEITVEKIAQHYSSAMDSVNLINAVIADPDVYANDETVMKRNVDHLELVIDWTFWTDEDLSPFTNTITAGKAHIAV
jgi:hypothetical protein|tara:strand:- start:147 stop:383 length:237 start_codon:yes stop_codon:yes gene_type:complete